MFQSAIMQTLAITYAKWIPCFSICNIKHQAVNNIGLMLSNAKKNLFAKIEFVKMKHMETLALNL